MLVLVVFMFVLGAFVFDVPFEPDMGDMDGVSIELPFELFPVLKKHNFYIYFHFFV